MKLPSWKNQRGIAMMMAMVTFLILSVLIGELAYETGVYNGVVWRQVDSLRARMLARSGLRLSLLQVRAAAKAQGKAKSLGLGDAGGLTDMIWKTPLVLPPPTPQGLGVNETQALAVFSKSLGLEGVITTSISGENGRINLNQMVWAKEGASGGGPTPVPISGSGTPPVDPAAKKKLLEGSRQAIATIANELIEAKKQSDDAFRDRHSTTTGDILVGNLLAWIDPLTEVDGENREKREYYSRLEPTPYGIKNAPLASESELFMVKGFDDAIAGIFADNFTTQSTSGIDVNSASPALLKALIPELGEFEVERIVQRRTDESAGGAFKNAEDFWGFLNSLGNYEDAKKRLTDQGVAILQKETSYRVVVTATSGNATKTWVALIGPMPPQVDPKPPATPGAQPQPEPDLTKTEEELAKEAEAKKNDPKNDSNSLNIIYLKAD